MYGRAPSLHPPRFDPSMVRFSVAKAAALVLLMLRPTEGEREKHLPPGLKIPQLPASRVSMETLNTINRLAPPKPSPWPAAFSISFATNLTEREWKHEGAFPPHTVKGSLWYDSVHGQRVLHGSGAVECSKFYSTQGNCSLVFNGDGMYALIPDQQRCCLDMPGLHVPPANWTLAKHKFVGTQRIRGNMCHGFSYLPGGLEGLQGSLHEYWQDVDTHFPCMFTFPGEHRMAWVFDVSSLSIHEPDAEMFVVPSTCKGSTCSPGQRKAVSQEAKSEAADLWRALYEQDTPDMASVIDEVLQGLTEEQKARLEEQARRKSMAASPVLAEPLTI